MSNCDNVLNTLPNIIEKLEVKDDKFLFFFDPIVIKKNFYLVIHLNMVYIYFL